MQGSEPHLYYFSPFGLIAGHEPIKVGHLVIIQMQMTHSFLEKMLVPYGKSTITKDALGTL